MKRPQIYEFVGLPGSGKSTLARQFEQAARKLGLIVASPSGTLDHGHPLVRKLVKFRYATAGKFCFRGSPLFNAVAAQFDSDCKSKTKCLFNLRYLGASMLNRPPLAIYDQGIFQGLWSVMFRTGSSKATSLDVAAVRSMIDKINCDYHVILVTTSAETIKARLTRRKTNHSLMEKEASPGIEKGFAGLEKIKQLLQNSLSSGVVKSLVEITNEDQEYACQQIELLVGKLEKTT